MLVPLALLLCRLSLPKASYPMSVAVVGAGLGAALGTVVMFPEVLLLRLIFPATCGALSGLAWLAFNRDAIQRQT